MTPITIGNATLYRYSGCTTLFQPVREVGFRVYLIRLHRFAEKSNEAKLSGQFFRATIPSLSECLSKKRRRYALPISFAAPQSNVVSTVAGCAA